jgi:5-hydroxyisourate hydrolase-like protein (transthyretin family)
MDAAPPKDSDFPMQRFAPLRPALLLALAVALLPGCKKQPQGPERVPTFPVMGQITVDGKPAATLAIRCHPTGEPKVALTSTAFTDAEGRFVLGTYEGGDGIPEGDYTLTFQWGQYNLMNGRYSGDKLKKRYSDPKKSEFSVSAKPGAPIDLGVIDLKMPN